MIGGIKLINKYLNKEVEIAEKIYNSSSTLDGVLGSGYINKINGTITGIDENFIELDNSILISIKFIYRITLV